MRKGRAFSLLSGGLDSLLATRLIMSQSIEVIGLHFITPFFDYDKKGREKEFAERYRDLYRIEARIIDVSEGFLRVVRHPRYGYGKNFNPCIDCKIFLFSQAKSLMEKEKVDFLVTGEVLGQRPMSQRRDTLRIVERDSGTEGILLRPLCAKNLKPTKPELEGLVDREKLLALSGRSRRPQIRLADEMGLQNYPTPAGGCMLTDPIMAGRIRKFFSQNLEVSVEDIPLLTLGRQFQFPNGARLIIGRREEENHRLAACFREGDLFLKIQSIPGPLGLLRGNKDREGLHLAASIVARYSKAKEWQTVEIQFEGPGNSSGLILVTPATDEQIDPLKF